VAMERRYRGGSEAVSCYTRMRRLARPPAVGGCVRSCGARLGSVCGTHIVVLGVDVGALGEELVNKADEAAPHCQVEGGRAILRDEGRAGWGIF
jgi:hypothetical protein